MFESQSKYGKIEDFTLQVARGQIPGHSLVRLHGYNPILGITPATIWPLATVRSLPATGQSIRVVSTSANDTLAGTGARTIVIQGLLNGYVPITEIINLNGTTPVTTLTPFFRIQHFAVIDAGAGRTNAGDITFTNAANTQTFDVMPATFSRRLTAGYTVPDGKSAFLVGAFLYFGQDTGSTLMTGYLVQREPAYPVDYTYAMTPSNNSAIEYSLVYTPQIPDKSDIEFRAYGNNPSNVCSVNATILLIDK